MSDPPQVALNARAAVREQIGGVERYAREVMARLRARHPERYRVIAPPRRLAHRAGHLWEQALLPLLARDCALIYSPANLAPLAGLRNAVVIHDVAALARPDAYSAAYVAYQRRMLPAIARRARLLITVSEFSRGEIAQRLGVDGERIVVIAGGVDGRFTPAAAAAAPRAAARSGSRGPTYCRSVPRRRVRITARLRVRRGRCASAASNCSSRAPGAATCAARIPVYGASGTCPRASCRACTRARGRW